MKVIGITGNYHAQPAGHYFLMADSALLPMGKDLYLPNLRQRAEAHPALLARVGRLGKCVAPRFAHRYVDAVTAGFVIVTHDDDPATLALRQAADSALLVGPWQATTQWQSDNWRLRTPQEEIALGDTTLSLDGMISQVSNYCSLKMGDIFITGLGNPLDLAPGMTLQADTGADDRPPATCRWNVK